MLEALEQRTLLSSYTVTSNRDSATIAGTLRYAITQIDNSGSSTAVNTISFNLPADELTIAPGSPLPGITKPVAINGASAEVVISGANAGSAANGLVLENGSSGSTIQALAINGFAGPSASGIVLESSNDVVINCDIETNHTGIFASGSGCVIGAASGNNGEDTNRVNVISGNTGDGIVIDAPLCVVEGNLIGTNDTGRAADPNQTGILVTSYGGSDTIGGTTAGVGNVISGNSGDGIDIEAPSCVVARNAIGTSKAVTLPLPNGGNGISLGSNSGGGQIIGGDGSGNYIAFNGGAGVAIAPGITGGDVEFNSIYDNTGAGIELDGGGPSPNAPGAANNAPVISSVDGGLVTGTLDAAANSTYIVDFYTNPASDASSVRPQGQTYLGSTTIETNADGNAGFSFSYTPNGLQPFVSATATDASGTTSDFSAPVLYSVTASGLTFDATAPTTFQGQVASFSTTDPLATATDFTATINWGDGTPSTAGTVETGPNGFIVVGAHTFVSPGSVVPVTVTITSTIDFGQATANSLADVSPGSVVTIYSQTANFVAGTQSAATLLNFTDSNAAAIVGQFTAAITWGDGTTGTGTVSASGAGFVVTGTHTFNYANPNQLVSVSMTDELTGMKYIVRLTVVVAPVPITIQPKNFAVTPGAAFSGAVATFTDTNPLTNPSFYTAKINWGDGTTTTGTISGTNPFTISGSHTYQAAALTDQGTAIVAITITDPNGQSATAVARAVDPPATSSVSDTPSSGAVSSPPSTVALAMSTENVTLSPGGSFRGIVATLADSGPPETASVYEATINWGNGRRSAGMVTGSNGRFAVSGKHVFPRFTGTKTATVTVTNEADGQSASVSELISAPGRKASAIRVARRDRSATKPHH